MAIDLSLHTEDDAGQDQDQAEPFESSAFPGDAAHEEALALAAKTWRAMRAQFDAVDPARLSAESRLAHARLLARIGLWADARSFGDQDED